MPIRADTFFAMPELPSAPLRSKYGSSLISSVTDRTAFDDCLSLKRPDTFNTSAKNENVVKY